ncbi:MAG: Peptidase S14 ClpP [Candidatus Jorgensenbacteria bacterium GW2011_GWA1_48_13]|uniref:Peptidase S14 ClpP n=2 Tax=Candidatus Joergenseniibacteriota TaxID=1752739 RepID=A0A0G1W8E4_9BACT|nr:MAG: Peptidase S14 ClpP [Candidatus Jorgensenbacteria bacterium GW2011_GWA1_48_13]KKU99298.1 MAG: Peptidase S14 ClpP [Candidatus Jorgensenbacteria bacterium GW2011_GWC1_48_8]KKW14978.1 MAG: Peptidase S14 ClpP [Candidatus Jorgensenbacteria bacterium GW2011_GWB1_50_10]
MDYYIVFAGIIEQGFGNRLLNAVNNATQQGAKKIILLFSSLGGSTQEGFTLASVIQNCKIPISIHATNNIDSIANVIYLSAKERTAESYAKFYMHGATTQGIFDEKGLNEQLLAVKTESTRIAYFISENCSLDLQKVQNMMKTGTSITAQQALQCGIVQAINHLEIPPKGVLREDIVIIN